MHRGYEGPQHVQKLLVQVVSVACERTGYLNIWTTLYRPLNAPKSPFPENNEAGNALFERGFAECKKNSSKVMTLKSSAYNRVHVSTARARRYDEE